MSIATVMQNTVDDIELSAFEVGLFNTMSREMVLKNCLDAVKRTTIMC